MQNPDPWLAALQSTLALAKDYEPQRRLDLLLANPQLEWSLEPTTEEVIRFSECDPFGHLNNSRYFDYFMNARDNHIHDAYFLDLSTHSAKTRENWVVKNHQIAYLRPARLRERIQIKSRLLEYTENETFVELLMLDHSGKHLKALLWSRFSYIHLDTGRIQTHPASILEILKRTKIPTPWNPSFEERVREVMNETRKRGGTVRNTGIVRIKTENGV